jgi:hypothetical protein
MDDPVFAQYQPALSRFSVQNQHPILYRSIYHTL